MYSVPLASSVKRRHDHGHDNDHIDARKKTRGAPISDEGIRDLKALLDDDETTSASKDQTTTLATTKDPTTTASNADLPSDHANDAKYYHPDRIRLNDIAQAAGTHLSEPKPYFE